MSASYVEFEWRNNEPANGDSGEGLARRLITLVRQMPDVQTICDLGCGNGYIANRLAAFGYNVFGVDASKTGIEIAKQNQEFALKTAKVCFVQTNIDKQILSRTSLSQVDLVISSDVLEHLYRPADLLEAAERILKPNGRILLTTPYHGYLKNLALALTGRLDRHFSALHDGGHIKFFSVKTLSELIKRHSFTDLTFSYYGRAPWLWRNMICQARKVEECSIRSLH